MSMRLTLNVYLSVYLSVFSRFFPFNVFSYRREISVLQVTKFVKMMEGAGKSDMDIL